MTVSDMLNRYESVWNRRHPASKNGITVYLEHWRQVFTNTDVDGVTPPMLYEERERLLAAKHKYGRSYSPATVNRYVSQLLAAYAWAVDEAGILDTHPFRYRYHPLGEHNSRSRYLGEDERRRLLKACVESRSKYLYPFVMVAITTGMRRGEIRALRWADIDFEARSILVRTSKNGHPRTCYLTDAALEALRRLPRNTTKPFPVNTETAWYTARRKAGLKDFRFHDLRHTFASYLRMTGTSLLDIADATGHRNLSMVRRYAHCDIEHLQERAQAMEQRYFMDSGAGV